MISGKTTKKRGKVSGSIKGQLILPGLEELLSSVASEGLRVTVSKNTYDPTWSDPKQD